MLIQWLKEIVKENLKSGLFVWYDPLSSFEDVVDKVIPKDAKLLKFEGSYLVLRFKLEDEDPEFEKKWVVYIPDEPGEFLKDWELMGSKEVLSLPDLLMAKGAGMDRELKKALEVNSRVLVKNWRILIGRKEPDREQIINALLAIAFELTKWDEDEAVIKFLSQTEKFASRLGEMKLTASWLRKMEEIIDVGEEDLQKIREKLVLSLLFGEIVYKGDQPAESFASLPKTREKVTTILERWRNDERYKEYYIEAVREISEKVKIKDHIVFNESLLNLETFPEIDEVILQELLSSTTPENYEKKVEKIREIAKKRIGTFWERNGFIYYWKPIKIAAELFIGCKKALEYDGQSRMIEKYVNEWWILDKLALELTSYKIEGIENLVKPAITTYERYLDKINRKFADAVIKEGWVQNHTSFWEYVKGAEKPVAVLFVDALRFDLAKMIVENVRGVENAEINWLYGVLPSITEVGMAALLPNSQIEIKKDNPLKVEISGESVSTKIERRSYLNRRGIEVIDFETASIPKKEILTVMVRDIDRLGEISDIAPNNLIDIADKISGFISRLRDAGFRTVIIGSDHGFLYLISQPNKVTCKGDFVARRFALGAKLEGCIIFKAAETGISGDLLLAFPVGTAVFAIQGETPHFVHGGLSLQEAVIPVVSLKLSVPKEKVGIKIESPRDKLTTIVAVVKLKPVFKRFDAEPRRVCVEINGKRSEYMTVTTEKVETVRLRWLEPDEKPPEEVELKVIDESGEVIGRREFKVSLLF
ncbi:MAG: alkaline phosphatase [Candidatus Syntrophoarchaeum butanivorans]|uniref:Alkaline phosphatase n=1 Tax=Candidatus Syntropharchaeum butanivorans TaxID=1839936 RepID=A0A1F2P7J4_9EURY|nr:MAG: alkaline phosphatase [Candidatus Syntrophoarchaeum butanivorans]